MVMCDVRPMRPDGIAPMMKYILPRLLEKANVYMDRNEGCWFIEYKDNAVRFEASSYGLDEYGNVIDHKDGVTWWTHYYPALATHPTLRFDATLVVDVHPQSPYQIAAPSAVNELTYVVQRRGALGYSALAERHGLAELGTVTGEYAPARVSVKRLVLYLTTLSLILTSIILWNVLGG